MPQHGTQQEMFLIERQGSEFPSAVWLLKEISQLVQRSLWGSGRGRQTARVPILTTKAHSRQPEGEETWRKWKAVIGGWCNDVLWTKRWLFDGRLAWIVTRYEERCQFRYHNYTMIHIIHVQVMLAVTFTNNLVFGEDSSEMRPSSDGGLIHTAP